MPIYRMAALIGDLAEDCRLGWSIGCFGAIAEFSWSPEEPAELRRCADRIEIATNRGAMRIVYAEFQPLAWDTLSPDGKGWGHVLRFCLPRVPAARQGIQPLGCDLDAVRPVDRDARLFDLGIGVDLVRMCVRTRNRRLAARLYAARGAQLLSQPGLVEEILRAQPHRVMLSPVSRIEVFQPIPGPHGRSPAGPHTHVMPQLVAANRAHSACEPLPDDMQAVLSLHPCAPWRLNADRTATFDPANDHWFASLLHRHGLPSDMEVREGIYAAVARGLDPQQALWPETRRGRTVARIALRRLAAAGDERVAPWRARYDSAPGARTTPGECG